MTLTTLTTLFEKVVLQRFISSLIYKTYQIFQHSEIIKPETSRVSIFYTPSRTSAYI